MKGKQIIRVGAGRTANVRSAPLSWGARRCRRARTRPAIVKSAERCSKKCLARAASRRTTMPRTRRHSSRIGVTRRDARRGPCRDRRVAPGFWGSSRSGVLRTAAENDLVAVHFTARGTNTGSGNGLAGDRRERRGRRDNDLSRRRWPDRRGMDLHQFHRGLSARARRAVRSRGSRGRASFRRAIYGIDELILVRTAGIRTRTPLSGRRF